MGGGVWHGKSCGIADWLASLVSWLMSFIQRCLYVYMCLIMVCEGRGLLYFSSCILFLFLGGRTLGSTSYRHTAQAIDEYGMHNTALHSFT